MGLSKLVSFIGIFHAASGFYMELDSCGNTRPWELKLDGIKFSKQEPGRVPPWICSRALMSRTSRTPRGTPTERGESVRAETWARRGAVIVQTTKR